MLENFIKLIQIDGYCKFIRRIFEKTGCFINADTKLSAREESWRLFKQVRQVPASASFSHRSLPTALRSGVKRQ